MRSDGFTTVTAQNIVFRDVTPCSWLYVYRFFEQPATAIFKAGDTVNSVGIATRPQVGKSRFRFPAGTWNFSPLRNVQTSTEAHSHPHSMGIGSTLLHLRAGVKWSGHVVDHSPPPTAEVKNELYLYSPLYAFMECTGTTSPIYPEDRGSRFLSNVQTTRSHIQVKTFCRLPPVTISYLTSNIIVSVSPFITILSNQNHQRPPLKHRSTGSEGFSIYDAANILLKARRPRPVQHLCPT